MSKSRVMPVWRLRAQADRRFRSGHPWIYSNELQDSPKGIEPGSPIELHDAGGRFMARGYGNPNSLIAFRAMTRDPEVDDPLSPDFLLKLLLNAGRARAAMGLGSLSHRLCFGEADGLPGLVIDRYRVQGEGQILAVQAHTAGMDRVVPDLPGILQKYVETTGDIGWPKTAIVLRNDLSVRRLEGIPVEEPRIAREVGGLDPRQARIQVAGALSGTVEFSADLVEGQKTGFFLDQMANVQLAARRLMALRPRDKALRVLDLCCYAGQWGAQLARVFREQGIEVVVLGVDASAAALERARANVEAQGARFEPMKADVLGGLDGLPDQSFDLVISDPPALIKGRKDIPTGTHAYLQLNTQVFRLVRPGGGVISCSCSALLEEDEFLKALSKAAYRHRASVRWIARGGQSPDHPVRIEFPEGRYLKCWIGLVAESLDG